MENIFGASISFFIALEKGAKEKKDAVISKLEKISEVEVEEVYNDGEDWCIDCMVTVSARNGESAEKKIAKVANKVNVTWDYHYIKGINNGYYWQP